MRFQTSSYCCIFSGVINPTSFSKADENPIEADAPSTSCEESDSSRQVESCSESETSDFSDLNWTWRAWVVKAALRRISNKLSAKKVPESQYGEVSSPEVYIGMDTVSMANIVRNSIGQPIQVQIATKPGAIQQGLKCGTEDNLEKPKIFTCMTHTVTTDEKHVNPECNQQNNGSLPKKRKQDNASEGRNPCDVESWSPDQPKRRRRKYKRNEMISKRQKLDGDGDSPISSSDDLPRQNSGSEGKGEEINLAESKRLRLRGLKGKKFSMHRVPIRESTNELNGESISGDDVKYNNKNTIQNFANNFSSMESGGLMADHERSGVRHAKDIPQDAILTTQSKLDAFVELMIKNAARSLCEKCRNKSGRSECSKPTSRASDSIIEYRNNDKICSDSNKHTPLSKSCFDLKRDTQNRLARSGCFQHDLATSSQIDCEQQNPNTQDVMERNLQCVPNVHEKQQNNANYESLSFHNVGCRENMPLKSRIPPQQHKYLSGTSLWRMSSADSAVNDSAMSNRTVASSHSHVYYEPEELVISRDIAGTSDHKEHLNANRRGMLLYIKVSAMQVFYGQRRRNRGGTGGTCPPKILQ